MDEQRRRRDFALAPYNPDGSLDTAGFGAPNGKVTTDFSGFIDFANGVAIQTDGKIVVVGAAALDATFRRHFAVARYNTDGSLDTTSFGGGTGKVTTDTSTNSSIAVASAVAIQGDGKIVVVGGAEAANLVCGCRHFSIARYGTDGGLDVDFGTGRTVVTDFVGGGDYATDVAIQTDGKIVVVGLVQPPADIESSDFGIARYNADGSLDGTFGTGGLVVTPFQGVDSAHGVAIQGDCKIVAAGFSWVLDTGDINFALARYDGGVCTSEPPVLLPCPKSQGYWKTHASTWPVTSLTLGDKTYGQAELLAILNTSSQTEASLILARQLIAAKLNVANGSDPAPIDSTIADADALLSGFSSELPYSVKSSSATGQSMVADAKVLEAYNKATLTPGCAP